MYKFGKNSEAKMETIDPRLVRVLRRALGYNVIDFSVTEGARSKAEQNRLYEIGRSKLMWPYSKHNVTEKNPKSEATDLMPWVNGASSDHVAHCCLLAGLMFAAAAEEGVPIRWGGNWDRDGEPVTDQSFNDLVHYELIT